MFDCPENLSKNQLIHNFANSEGVGIMEILKELPDEFKYNDFIQLSQTMYKITISTSKRNLKIMIEKGFLIRIEKGIYQKTDKLKEYMENFKNDYFK